MSLPAARRGHKIHCGKHSMDGTVQGQGASGINIGGASAARLGDTCLCVVMDAAPIVEGSSTVLMNGVPAARVSMKTLHPGVIIEGEPMVRIGGPTFSMPSFVRIEGTAEFEAIAYRHFFTITRTRSGQLWLASFGATGKRLTIREQRSSRGSKAKTDPELTEERLIRGPPGGLNKLTSNDIRSTDGTGIDSTIDFNPTPNPRRQDARSDATLFHEMVHADDMAHGSANETWCANPGGGAWDDPILCGERRASGLSPYADETECPFNENTYRRERNYPPRDYY